MTKASMDEMVLSNPFHPPCQSRLFVPLSNVNQIDVDNIRAKHDQTSMEKGGKGGVRMRCKDGWGIKWVGKVRKECNLSTINPSAIR